MSSYKRKLKRQKEKQAEKELQKDVAQKMNMFDRLGESCSACRSPFDKKNRDMVMSWNVVVREQEDVVRLYCPSCWNMAIETIKELENV